MSETGKDIALVPENVPDYIRNNSLAREMNAEATEGISTGFPPSIRIKNGKFRLVDGAGEETVLKAKDLVVNDDGQFLPIVVLRAKKGLTKVWYAKPYDPNAESSAFRTSSPTRAGFSGAPWSSRASARPRSSPS